MENTNLQRALALKQFNGEEFFVIELEDTTTAYEGNEEQARKEFEAEIEGTDEASIDDNFELWCSNNLTQIEEMEADDTSANYLVLTDEEARETCLQMFEDCNTKIKKLLAL